MLDLIYISEEVVSEPSASVNSKETSKNKKKAITLGGFDASSLAFIAGAVLFSPLTATAAKAVVSSLLGFAVDSKKGIDSPEANESASLIIDYLQSITFTPKQAKSKGYIFQPGHPISGKSYKKHPLADCHSAKKESLYIPSDNYDAILLEERESELMKLLVHLGATKISITKKIHTKQICDKSINGTASIKNIAGGGVSYNDSSENISSTQDTREFSLSGRKWGANEKVKKDDFFWLDFEPSWSAVVYARECGGCLSASLEIKENTSFSSNKKLEASIEAQLLQVKGGGELARTNNDDAVYFIRVEFSPIEEK